MNPETKIIPLHELEYLPYLAENGAINPDFKDKIGIYAIFDQDKILQFVGYSRDIYLSLKQHLVRQLDQCCWLKVHTISQINRTILQEISQAWLEENGTIPLGNGENKAAWNEPIDAKLTMTAAEKIQYDQLEEGEKMKLLKQVVKRLEAEIQENCRKRGITMAISFNNMKLKEKGLLDLK